MIVIAPGVPSGTTNGPSGHGSRIEKYGPTVWEGVIGGTSPSAPLLEDGRVAAAQHDVPVVAEGPLGLGQLDVEVGDQPLPGLLVGHRVEDRVERQQRGGRDVHLGDHPLGRRAAEQRDGELWSHGRLGARLGVRGYPSNASGGWRPGAGRAYDGRTSRPAVVLARGDDPPRPPRDATPWDADTSAVVIGGSLLACPGSV